MALKTPIRGEKIRALVILVSSSKGGAVTETPKVASVGRGRTGVVARSAFAPDFFRSSFWPDSVVADASGM